MFKCLKPRTHPRIYLWDYGVINDQSSYHNESTTNQIKLDAYLGSLFGTVFFGLALRGAITDTF